MSTTALSRTTTDDQTGHLDASSLITEAFGVTGHPLSWTFSEAFHVVISRYVVADSDGRLPQAYVQTLLTLAEQHHDAAVRIDAATALPPEHWRTAIRVLAAAPGHRLDAFIQHMPNRGERLYQAPLADEVFDHLWALTVSTRGYTNDRDLSWLPADTPEPIRQWWQDLDLKSNQIFSLVRAIDYGLREAAERTSPQRAACFVRDHTSTPFAAPAIGRLIAHLTDAAAFDLLFDIRNDVAPWLDRPLYLWRRECLHARSAPAHLADRQILDSGTTPLGDDFPHVAIEPLREATNLARIAAIKADPALVAALVLADPQRWWAQLTRTDVSTAKPRGIQARLNSRAVHTALARLVHDTARQATTDPALLDATHDTHSVYALATRGTVRDRLIWLIEKASGSGFDAALDALVAIPDVKVRRRVAKHPQATAEIISTLANDPDARVRTNALQSFSRALAAC